MTFKKVFIGETAMFDEMAKFNLENNFRQFKDLKYIVNQGNIYFNLEISKNELLYMNDISDYSDCYMIEKYGNVLKFYKLKYKILFDVEICNKDKIYSSNLIFDYMMHNIFDKNVEVEKAKLDLYNFKEIHYLNYEGFRFELVDIIKEYLNNNLLNEYQKKSMEKYIEQHPEKFI
jgi:hypothetical protein